MPLNTYAIMLQPQKILKTHHQITAIINYTVSVNVNKTKTVVFITVHLTS